MERVVMERVVMVTHHICPTITLDVLDTKALPVRGRLLANETQAGHIIRVC
jgi:hypothetical protein